MATPLAKRPTASIGKKQTHQSKGSLLSEEQWQQMPETLTVRRWDIELKLRDFKTTLKMEKFKVNTPEMAHKTLWMSLIAINLMRSMIQTSAAHRHLKVGEISFKSALNCVLNSREHIRSLVGKPRQHREYLHQLIEIIGSQKLK